MDPRLHLLMSLAIGAVLMWDGVKDRRKYALIGALGIVGLLPDADILVLPGSQVRVFESALFIIGVPMAIFAVASVIERGGAETIRRRFAIASLAVLFAHVIMDAAKGHTPAILYPFSDQRFEFRFGDPEVAYSGVAQALALVALMSAAAFVANRFVLAAADFDAESAVVEEPATVSGPSRLAVGPALASRSLPSSEAAARRRAAALLVARRMAPAGRGPAA
jgi:membrane-bound metal-dependent hydrolase YbcI (DUF457 family)